MVDAVGRSSSGPAGGQSANVLDVLAPRRRRLVARPSSASSSASAPSARSRPLQPLRRRRDRPRRAPRRGRRRRPSGRRSERSGPGSEMSASLGSLGDDASAEATDLEREPLVVVVDDREGPDQARAGPSRRSRTLDQPGLGALAPVLEVEREVVQRGGRLVLVANLGDLRLTGGPLVGSLGVRIDRRRRPPVGIADRSATASTPASSARPPRRPRGCRPGCRSRRARRRTR